MTPALRAASKTRAALLSSASGAALTLAKLVVGLLTGSLSILSEALHSLLDLVAAIITYFVVRLSDRPADADHPYGHARAEQLGALAETVLLSVTATLILVEVYRRLFVEPQAPEVSVWSFVVMGGSIVVDLIRVRALRQAARAHGSAALEADAANFANDLLSSTLVLLSLGLILLAPRLGFIPSAVTNRVDAVAAAIVALLAFRVAITLAWRAVNTLMDGVPRDLNARLLRAVEGVAGVLPGTARVRSRLVGEVPFVDVAVGVNHAATLAGASGIARQVEAAIRAEQPRADVVVDVRPARSDAEEHGQAIRAAAHRLSLDVHHLDVLLLADGLHIDVDLELAPELTLQAAHAQSEALERELRAALPMVRRIGVHLEPRFERTRPAVRHPVTADAARRALEAALPPAAIRSVEAALTDEGAVVHMHVEFDGNSTLDEVHRQMARLERGVRAQVPGVQAVHIDPEPGEPTGEPHPAV